METTYPNARSEIGLSPRPPAPSFSPFLRDGNRHGAPSGSSAIHSVRASLAVELRGTSRCFPLLPHTSKVPLLFAILTCEGFRPHSSSARSPVWRATTTRVRSRKGPYRSTAATSAASSLSVRYLGGGTTRGTSLTALAGSRATSPSSTAHPKYLFIEMRYRLIEAGFSPRAFFRCER